MWNETDHLLGKLCIVFLMLACWPITLMLGAAWLIGEIIGACSKPKQPQPKE